MGSIILETAVGRARWWVRAGGWREATTRQAHACKEERQSQAPVRTCQRARSEFTHSVTPDKARALAFLLCSGRQQQSTAVSRIILIPPSAPATGGPGRACLERPILCTRQGGGRQLHSACSGRHAPFPANCSRSLGNRRFYAKMKSTVGEAPQGKGPRGRLQPSSRIARSSYPKGALCARCDRTKRS